MPLLPRTAALSTFSPLLEPVGAVCRAHAAVAPACSQDFAKRDGRAAALRQPSHGIQCLERVGTCRPPLVKAATGGAPTCFVLAPSPAQIDLVPYRRLKSGRSCRQS